MSVSVVVVSYRTPDLTMRATETALRAGADEVIVVDNASGDGTIAALRSLPGLHIMLNAENVGFGAAANRGAREATADVLVFLNSDAELTSNALEELIRDVEGCGMRAICAPRLIGPGGVIQQSSGLLPSPDDLAYRALGLHHLARRATQIPVLNAIMRRSHVAREYASAITATETIDTTMVSGACFAVGRDAFWELGGFDERFFMYFEDADLCRRAAGAGMRIRYVPSAVVTHIGGASSEGDYRFGPMHARSMRQYLEKWWGWPGARLAIVLLWLRVIGHVVAFRPSKSKAVAALRAASAP